MNRQGSLYRSAATFICEACCCGDVELHADDGYVYAECDHIVMVIKDNTVVEIHSVGVRQ